MYANLSDPSNAVFITGSNASFQTGSDTNSTKDNWNTVKYSSGPSSLFGEPETKQIESPMPPTEQLCQVAVPSSSAEDTGVVANTKACNEQKQKSGPAQEPGPLQKVQQ